MSWENKTGTPTLEWSALVAEWRLVPSPILQEEGVKSKEKRTRSLNTGILRHNENRHGGSSCAQDRQCDRRKRCLQVLEFLQTYIC